MQGVIFPLVNYRKNSKCFYVLGHTLYPSTLCFLFSPTVPSRKQGVSGFLDKYISHFSSLNAILRKAWAENYGVKI